MRYQVVIYEVMSHSITVEADNRDGARELAYDLVSNENTEYLENNYGYSIDGEYSGECDIYEEATL